MATQNVKLPDIGEGVTEGELVKWLVKIGDKVSPDQPVAEVMTDKATVEVPTPYAGVVKELKVKLGDKVAEGSLLLVVDADAGAAASATPAASAAAVAATAPATSAPVAAPVQVPTPTPTPVASATAAPAATAPAGKAHASPSIRKFARELGVDLSKVAGSGEKGRITQEDVQNFVKGILAGSSAVSSNATPSANAGAGLNLLPWPSLDFSKFGATALLPLSRIKKLSGPNLHRNWVMIPHVTQFDEADISDLEEFRNHPTKHWQNQALS